MLRKKFRLLCYKKNYINKKIVILPFFLKKKLKLFVGNKVKELVIKKNMLYFNLIDFFITKKRGFIIHRKNIKKKKK